MKLTKEQLAEILEKHAQWLRGDGGERADLTGANLRDAYLRGANLTGAYLRGANLTGANLRDAYLRGANLGDANLTDANLTGANLTRADLAGADLAGADLAGADLTRANLAGADLARANLTRANLTRADLADADLTGTCLALVVTPFDWASGVECDFRTVDQRVLVLGSRTQSQPHMNGPEYELGRLYRAPVFSRDPCTSCHPGLYVAGGPEEKPMLVAFWLDEAIIVEKCRVPRFRTLKDRKEFQTITTKDMNE